jgi:hypothetical protein
LFFARPPAIDAPGVAAPLLLPNDDVDDDNDDDDALAVLVGANGSN